MQRRPVVAGVAALVVLVVLALPFFSMRLAFTDAGNDPTTTTTRQAFDALATGFGPGFNGPLIIAATVPEGQQGRRSSRCSGQGGRHPGVAFATPAQFSAVGRRRGDHRLPHHLARSRPRPRPSSARCATT